MATRATCKYLANRVKRNALASDGASIYTPTFCVIAKPDGFAEFFSTSTTACYRTAAASIVNYNPYRSIEAARLSVETVRAFRLAVNVDPLP